MGLRLVHYSDVENAYDRPDRIGRLAGLLGALDGPDAVLAGTGDNTAPGVLPLVTEGRQALDLFDAVEPDLETFGNHDFDYGLESTRDVVAASPQTWLTANVWEGEERFGARQGTEPWTVVDRAGVRLGCFGLTDPHTAGINPWATDVTFTDPIEAAAEAIDALRDRDVDALVALSHLGSTDEELAVEFDLDVVLGGHVHSERVERLEGTLLTRPGVNGAVVFEVDLAGDPTVRRHETDEGPRDDAVADRLRRRMAAAGLDDVVARVTEPIERSEATVFRGESRIGNFVADAYRWATDADVGLQNSGGIRSGEPLEGAVTVADLISIVPFEETVAVAQLTGAEFRETMRQASGANLGFGEPEWWHGHLSGAEVVWNHAGRSLEAVRVGGDPVRESETYTVATTEYLFFTDHEFPALDESHRVETHGPQYEILAAYAREHGVDPAIEGRIRRR